MSENQKSVQADVSVQGYPGIADASPTLNLIFSTLCFMFWANTMGLMGEGATLAIGMMQLAFFTGYTVGGYILCTRGNAFGGNTFLIFAAFFGGAGGFGNTAYAITQHVGIPFSYRIVGVAFLTSGLFLLYTLPGLLTAPKIDFLCFLTGGIGVFAYGLGMTELLGSWIYYIGAWSLFIDGVLATYCVFQMMLAFTGTELSRGRPFREP